MPPTDHVYSTIEVVNIQRNVLVVCLRSIGLNLFVTNVADNCTRQNHEIKLMTAIAVGPAAIISICDIERSRNHV